MSFSNPFLCPDRLSLRLTEALVVHARMDENSGAHPRYGYYEGRQYKEYPKAQDPSQAIYRARQFG